LLIRELGEFGLIEKLKKRTEVSDPSVIKGIGDDCAVIKISNRRFLLVTCDLLLEGVHFNRTYTDSYHLGKKALVVNLSDIAAMGGIPRFYLVSLGLPPNLPLTFIERLHRGMEEVAREFNLSLIGGNISSSQKILIDLTVLGETKPSEIIYRDGAQTGDAIFVTGTLGNSALGLISLKSGMKEKHRAGLKRFREAHLSPYPRVKEGRLIAKHRLATAMIDISDGLISDLRHILKESKKGAEVWVDRIPLSPEFMKFSEVFKGNRIDLALAGGEDYELLFTVPQDRLKRLNRLSRQLSLPVTMIGKIIGEKDKISLIRDDGKAYPLTREGFRHF
jgi:thiamine-monophosphate kinase